jgi:hypothetical protein
MDYSKESSFEPISTTPTAFWEGLDIVPVWISRTYPSRLETEGLPERPEQKDDDLELKDEPPLPALNDDGSRPCSLIQWTYPHDVIRFYGIARGFRIGVVDTLAEHNSAVLGFSGASSKRFSTYPEAVRWLDNEWLPRPAPVPFVFDTPPASPSFSDSEVDDDIPDLTDPDDDWTDSEKSTVETSSSIAGQCYYARCMHTVLRLYAHQTSTMLDFPRHCLYLYSLSM